VRQTVCPLGTVIFALLVDIVEEQPVVHCDMARCDRKVKIIITIKAAMA
jgi:hypothetical protein